MANKYIPFGYEISDGEIKIVEREAEVVRNVYSLYVQGCSLKNISERLNLLTITYAGDGRVWDKNMVKRMLENTKYTGDKDYPPIIPRETAETALKCKSEKAGEVSPEDKKFLDALRNKMKCRVCGSKMLRQHAGSGEKRKIYWKCSDVNCVGHRHVLSEKKLGNILASLFDEIADNPGILDTKAEKGYEKNHIVMLASNEAAAVMENLECDTETALKTINQLASVKFDHCHEGDNSEITKKIKECFALYPQKDKADGVLIQQVIERIGVTPDKTLYIKLINGREFERREKKDGSRICTESDLTAGGSHCYAGNQK